MSMTVIFFLLFIWRDGYDAFSEKVRQENMYSMIFFLNIFFVFSTPIGDMSESCSVMSEPTREAQTENLAVKSKWDMYFPGGSDGKSVCLQCSRPGFDPWVGKIPWGRKWQPTPVLLPGESHGGRSMIGYSPWGHKESDTTERLPFTFCRWSIYIF